MAVPSSGELKLWDTIWNQEIGAAQGNNSLHGAAQYAGFSTPDAMSDFYGWSDVVAPTVQSLGFNSISTSAMRAYGTVNQTGGENPTRGFYFGRSTNMTSNGKTSVGVGGAGDFNRTFTGLPSGTTHYAWAYACNSAGEAVGARIQAATSSPPPPPPFTPSLVSTYSEVQSGVQNPTGYMATTRYGGFANPYTGGGNTQFYDSQAGDTGTGRVCGSSSASQASANSRNYRVVSNTGGGYNAYATQYNPPAGGYAILRNTSGPFISSTISPTPNTCTNTSNILTGYWYGFGRCTAETSFCTS